jgi:hypothetical protein
LQYELTADGFDHFVLPVATGRKVKVAVVACLPAKGYMHVYARHGFFAKLHQVSYMPLQIMHHMVIF